jgi:hypothetical protein
MAQALTISGDFDTLYTQILNIIASADNEEYMTKLYAKIMYEVHVLAFDVTQNKHLFDFANSYENVCAVILDAIFSQDRLIVSLFIDMLDPTTCYIMTDNFITREFIKSSISNSKEVQNAATLRILPKFLSMEINLLKHFDVEKIYDLFNKTEYAPMPQEKRISELYNFFKNGPGNPDAKFENVNIKEESLNTIKKMFSSRSSDKNEK